MPKMIEKMFMIAEKWQTRWRIKFTRETKLKKQQNPNLNDQEINDNSIIGNLITVTKIGCNNGNLKNSDKFNIPLKILLNYNKGKQTKNNTEYITTDLFDIFYNDYID